MSNMQIVRINRISDGDLLVIADGLGSLYGNCATAFTLPGNVAIEAETLKSRDDVNETNYVAYMQLHPTSGSPDIKIEFHRGATKDWEHAHPVRTPSLYFDEFSISRYSNQSKQPLTGEQVLGALDVIRQHTTQAAPAPGTGELAATDILNQQISELGSLQRRLNEETIASKRALEDEYKERSQKLISEIETERSNLKKQKDKLEVLRKNLDDRSHMHVRRELREQITEQAKARAMGSMVTKRSLLERYGIFIGCMILSLLAGLFALKQFDNLEPSQIGNLPYWIMLAKAATSSAVCIGIGLLALNWLRRDHLDDVRSQRNLERYASDVDRASWIIETVMDIKQDKDNVVPGAWIDGVCRTLFDPIGAKDNHHEAADMLGALFNVAGRAELGPNGVKFEMDRKDSRRAAKALRSESKEAA